MAKTTSTTSTTDSTSKKSNQQIGAEHLARLAQYLEHAERVPERHGKANISAIAVGAGLDRQVLYRDEAQALIREAVTRKGLGMPDQQRAPGGEAVPAWAAQRIKDLEEQVAVLRAEAADLRGQLHRYAHLERHLETTGMLAR